MSTKIAHLSLAPSHDFSQSQAVEVGSAVAVPALQGRLRIYRHPAHVDLEVQMAADRDRVAGLPHRADSLAGVDALAAVDQGRAGHVGVEVGAVLAFAVNQQVVAIEDRVIAGAQDLAVADRDQGRAAGGDDVEALVDATAVTRSAEFTDRAAGAVRALDREDVVEIGDAAVGRGNSGRGRGGRNRS
jgi:hypothetical protein